MTAHSIASGLELHEDKRIKNPVRAVSTTNIAIGSPGATIDGISMVTGDRLLVAGQTLASQNGIYTFVGAASSMSRASDCSSSTDFVYGFKVFVREGTSFAATYWTFTSSATITVGSTSITFAQDPPALANQTANTVYAGPSTGSAAPASFRALVNADLPSSPTITGEMTAADFKVSGLTGATQGMRIVGATLSGSPASGTFAVGDVIFDLTGKIWACSGAGSPGTWVQVGGGMSNPMTTNQDLVVGGASGTPARLGIGANSQVLGITSGVIGWVNNPSGFTNPMTTNGDMITGGASGAPARLANGANAQVLTIIGGVPGWANPSGGGGGVTNNVATALYLSQHSI